MTKIEELHYIEELLKKHNLPISPILEYSIQEREKQYLKEEEVFSVQQPKPLVYHKDLETYKYYLSHLSVGSAGGKKLPHKAILLLAIISQIESGVMNINEIPLDNMISRAFVTQWNALISNIKSPSVWTPFWYLKTEPFWHFKAASDEQLLEGLLSFGGHPSIGQMRPIIKYGYLDNELFLLFQKEPTRNLMKEILVKTYVLPFIS